MNYLILSEEDLAVIENDARNYAHALDLPEADHQKALGQIYLVTQLRLRLQSLPAIMERLMQQLNDDTAGRTSFSNSSK